MRCPECMKEAPDNASECPGCGLELANWRLKAESTSSGSVASGLQLAGSTRPRSAPVQPRAPVASASRSPVADNLGSLISGVFFVLMGVVGLLGRHNFPPGARPAIGMAIAFLLGAGLIVAAFVTRPSFYPGRGNKLGYLVVVLSLLGILVVSADGHWGLVALGLVLIMANGLLLFGRVSIAKAIFASMLLVPTLAFGFLVAARNASAMELYAKLTMEIRGSPLTEVQGRTIKYRLSLPETTRWFEASRLQKETGWVLISPAAQSLMIINAVQVTSTLSFDEIGDKMLGTIRELVTNAGGQAFEEVDRELLHFPTDGLSFMEGILLRVQFLEKKRSTTGLVAVIRKGPGVYIIFYASPTEYYLTLAAELRTMLDGFVPGESTPAAAAPAANPTLAPAPTPPPSVSASERQGKCRTDCDLNRGNCECARYESPNTCKQRCDREMLECMSRCK